VFKIIIFLSLLLTSLNAKAEWLCKEASSTAEGNIFYACGHSIALTLSESRKNSLLNAKEEFRQFCKESFHCKNSAYTISPMRTDCSKVNKRYSCYRGLKYKLSNKKRSQMEINSKTLAENIVAKEAELEKLQKKIQDLEYLEKLNQDIKRIIEVEQLETDIEYLKDIEVINKNKIPFIGNAGMIFYFVRIPLTEKSQGVFGIGADYERYIYSDLLGLRFQLAYLTGSSSKELDQRGTANTTSRESFHSHKGVDTSISLPIHSKNASIAPKFGYTGVSYEASTKSYNEYGVGLSEQTTAKKFDDTYIGLEFRYGYRFHGAIDARRYFKARRNVISGSIGISIEF